MKLIIYFLIFFSASNISAQTLIASSNSIEATANHNQRKIVRDSLDNVYVVFVDSTEQGKIIKGLWLNKQVNDWTSATEIVNGTNPSLSINKYGKFSLVFESNDSLKAICYTSSWDFSNWSPTKKISDSDYYCCLPICDSDSTGKLNIFWIKYQASSQQSLMFASLADGTLYNKRTIATKSVINDIAIANHLRNFDDNVIFSLRFMNDSLQFLRLNNNSETIDTIYETLGSQPCISYNDLLSDKDRYYTPNEYSVRIMYLDNTKKLIEAQCILDALQDNVPSRIVESQATDFICIDDVLVPLGYGFLYMKNGNLYSGFSYGALGGWSTILDSISTNPMNPSLAYKNFSPLFIDYIWMERNNNSFDIYYKRDEKQKNVSAKDYESGKGFSITGYPNPFNDILNIEINVNDESNQPIIEIYDLNLKKLNILQPTNQSNRKYYYRWDINDLLPSGIYFLKCTVGQKTIVRKVIYKK
jgi:hypothetical protein